MQEVSGSSPLVPTINPRQPEATHGSLTQGGAAGALDVISAAVQNLRFLSAGTPSLERFS